MAPRKTVPLSPDLAQMLAGHRKKFKEQDWALAWYLAAECCARFHASHGLAFEPIAHSGLGYYGIVVRPLACKANGHSNQPILGRFTICGDAENWVPGGPGSNRLGLSGMLHEGKITPEEALPAAIRHLRLPLIPLENHYRCRHKARGASYVLLFRLSAMLALHLPMGEVSLWNDWEAFDRLARECDPHVGKKEHPGLFLFGLSGDENVVIAGDGRVLRSRDPSPSLWERHMAGESEVALARWLLDQMKAS